MKNFVTMMMAAVAIVMGVCSCGDDKDEPEVAIAAQVAGPYTGEEIISVPDPDGTVWKPSSRFVRKTATVCRTA